MKIYMAEIILSVEAQV